MKSRPPATAHRAAAVDASTADALAAARADIHARVTARILEDLDRGVRPWMRTWSAADRTASGAAGGGRPMRHTGEQYRGINVVLLWAEAAAQGFVSPMWMTYRQAQALGGQVRRGERGSLVVYADRVTRAETGDDGRECEREIAFLQGYTVFNVDQIDGLPAPYAAMPKPVPSKPVDLHRASEAFFRATRAVVRHGGEMAYYASGADVIQLPYPALFRDAQSYAATKAHELIHWTGHQSRLARTFGRRFGDDAYAVEELVAELGAAFLCADLGITPEVREDRAAYLAHWLGVLQRDSRAIMQVASHAQRAVDELYRLVQREAALQAVAQG